MKNFQVSMADWKICCIINGISCVFMQTNVLPEGRLFLSRTAWSPSAPINMQ